MQEQWIQIAREHVERELYRERATPRSAYNILTVTNSQILANKRVFRKVNICKELAFNVLFKYEMIHCHLNPTHT